MRIFESIFEYIDNFIARIKQQAKRLKNSRQQDGGKTKRKRPPIFAIALVACFIIIPAILFVNGMRDAPGRVSPADEPLLSSVSSEESTAPATPPESTPEEPQEPTPTPMPPAVKVKGVYYIVEFSTSENLQACIELIETTNLNAIVIDVKDDHGHLTFPTENEALKDASDAFRNDLPNALRLTGETVADLKERGIYTIARVVCFQDNRYATERPQDALQSIHGGAWRGNNNRRWLDPYFKENWDYILEFCKEAAKLGFDEVQLDYVRFPTDGRMSEIKYSAAASEITKVQIINEFVAYIREEMIKLGLRTSVDIFGIAGVSEIDATAIGQDVQLLYGSADSICPMIYPSHFASISANGVGSIINGVLFERPDTEPYDVMYNVLQHYVRQLNQFKEANPATEPAVLRPYLQYFTAGWLLEEERIDYGAEEVKAQIQAVHDAGFDEWLLWVDRNSYDAAAIP